MRKACNVCGRSIPLGETRCEEHRIPKRTGSYGRDAKRVVATATRCALCGEGPREGDPFVTDHRIPRGLGGSEPQARLRRRNAKHCSESTRQRLAG